MELAGRQDTQLVKRAAWTQAGGQAKTGCPDTINERTVNATCAEPLSPIGLVATAVVKPVVVA